MQSYNIYYMKNGTYKIPDARSTSPTSEQLEAYESGPQKISDEIKNLTVSQVNYRPSSKEWNINQIIVHLADTEMVFCERIRRNIAEEKPLLQSFDQEIWASGLFYDKQDFRIALQLFKVQRKSTSRLLRLLTPVYWNKEGIREGNIYTIYDILLVALHHVISHISQIQKIKSDPHFPSR